MLAGIELPLSGLIQQTTPPPPQKKKIAIYFFLLPRKQGLTFMQRRQFAWNANPVFLEEWEKYFKMSSAETFTQSVRRYGLHKQIAHWSLHGKTYNKTCMKRRISLHTLSLHISSLIRAFANRMYLLQSLGLTKRLVWWAKTRVNLPTAHSDKSIRWSYLTSIAGLSKAG